MVLASLVIVSHSFTLGGFGPDPIARITHGEYTLGEVAVVLFFLLSGFLITRSSVQSRSIGRFLWHRSLRVLPGYWVCLLVTAFVFAPLFHLIKKETFFIESAFAYLRGNWAMFHASGFSIVRIMLPHPVAIGGVLNGNPHPWINGSLWSLPFECACYLALALLALCRVLRRSRLSFVLLFVLLWALYAFSALDCEYFNECFSDLGWLPLIKLTLFFSAGSVCYLYRDKIPASKILFVISVCLLGFASACGSFGLVAPVALSYAFLWVAFRLPIHRFDARGDFSYGTYIYAFPIQQGLVLLRIQENGFLFFLGATLLITVLFAVLSYRWVESPCLKWKSFDFLCPIRKVFRLRPDGADAVLLPIAD
ncbi:MAG TPA: acyltransferase [Chthoniobacterales bacterium]|jgi:peptidoglycan/LPS O-acetylase OafA/YrhL|nr:acyltransferase [Chthoniobacterales bacterium]